MKIKKGFTVRNIAGSDIVVPVGNAEKIFNGMITLNESGAFFWNALLKDTTVDEVVKKVTSEYDVDEERAKADVEKFIEQLRENNLIEE
ncbi:PqqD family protein [Eubacterium coprostanoligenes]|uniref:Coenzyme PQQ synthesis protein D (PqqD) n=1 Tax=Eubacterium coprostanoligenes TaxID=290054 RepID=A0A1T4KAV6_9FIRM|nr:PqqD family protein [Eubacterium coprostanoligenes]MCI6254258.1 PqqD family protein [Eubacterium coprostanoligenes]MCI6354959.1 PqqD family protein [Eubacterium coprostanoligenes]MCI7265260.1 PqqD family protein [Eubacterium coprostanoligenes]MDD6666258.1 PqqD family protein [Eubacterium coprostanoligenes]MDY5399260.1 PqqD family protein [Eubacterium coprostanoligenes]